VTRAAAVKRGRLQTESDSDENDPDKLADETVVAIFTLPLIVEKGADAVTVKPRVAVPTPPATASSSASVSSIMISIFPPSQTCRLMIGEATINYKANVLHITNLAISCLTN
jgi:hypothetical protein